MFRRSSPAVLVFDETQSTDFDRRSRWLSCGRTQEHMWTCDMRTTLGNWRQHLVSCILHTITCVSMLELVRCQELFAMSHAEIYDQNKTCDIWNSVCTWQTQSNSPTNACFRTRCSGNEMTVFLTTTHITDVWVCETWMPVEQALNRCDTSTDLLPNPGLPVLFSTARHSFLPSAALCSRTMQLRCCF